MAGIDKTYVKSWEDYKIVRDWVESVGQVKDDFGNIFSPLDWLSEWEESDFKGTQELPIWNTPLYLDVWLIRHCPLPIIQSRLQEQYGEEYVEIKEGRSVYDHYVRPAASSQFKVYPPGYFPRGINRSRYYYIDIQEDSGDWMFDDEGEKWVNWKECRPWNTNTMTISGPITRRKFKRVIQKCGFPAGVKLMCYPNYGEFFEVVIKK